MGDRERSQSPTSDCDRERSQSPTVAIARGRLRLAIVKESVHVSFCARFSGSLFSFGFTFCTFILAVKLLSCARQALVMEKYCRRCHGF